MKKQLLALVLALTASANYNTTPPFVNMQEVKTTINPQPQMGIVVPALLIGGGALAIGWGVFKIIDKVQNLWEHKVTNGVPEVRFTFAEDEYPE